MKKSLIALSQDALGSLRDLTPIVIVIGVFQIWVIKQPVSGFVSLIFGALFVVARSHILHFRTAYCAVPNR